MSKLIQLIKGFYWSSVNFFCSSIEGGLLNQSEYYDLKFRIAKGRDKNFTQVLSDTSLIDRKKIIMHYAWSIGILGTVLLFLLSMPLALFSIELNVIAPIILLIWLVSGILIFLSINFSLFISVISFYIVSLVSLFLRNAYISLVISTVVCVGLYYLLYKMYGSHYYKLQSLLLLILFLLTTQNSVSGLGEISNPVKQFSIILAISTAVLTWLLRRQEESVVESFYSLVLRYNNSEISERELYDELLILYAKVDKVRELVFNNSTILDAVIQIESDSNP